MYGIDYTHQFKKDLRKCAKRGDFLCFRAEEVSLF